MSKFWKLLLVLVPVVVAAGAVAYAQTHTFEDVPEGHYAEPAIGFWSANGVMNGVSDAEFGFGDPVTREDLAVVLLRALGPVYDELDTLRGRVAALEVSNSNIEPLAVSNHRMIGDTQLRVAALETVNSIEAGLPTLDLQKLRSYIRCQAHRVDLSWGEHSQHSHKCDDLHPFWVAG